MAKKSRTTAFFKIVCPLLLVVLAIGCGTVGFRLHHLPEQSVPWSEAFLMAAGLPLMQTTHNLVPGAPIHWTLQTGRVVGALVPPYAFLLALLVAFRRPYLQLIVASWRWRRYSRHAVVCGLGWKGFELVRDLRKRRSKVAILDTNPDNPFADEVGGTGVVLFHDNATSEATLRRAGVRYAKTIYVATGDDELNCRVVNQIVGLLPKVPKVPQCYVDVEDASLRQYLAEWTAKLGCISVACFDIQESTARGVLQRRAIDRFTADERPQVAHVAVVGSSLMARALLIQLLRIGHFGAGKQLQIDVLAEDVIAYQSRLYQEMPCLSPDWGEPDSPQRRIRDHAFPQIDFQELPCSDSDLLDERCSLYRGLALGHISSLFFCIDDGFRSAALAGRMMKKLEALCNQRNAELLVGCYYNYPEDPKQELARALDKHSSQRITVFHFGSYDEECTVDAVEGRSIDALAREFAANYERQYGQPPAQGLAPSQKAAYFDRLWRASDEWAKESNRQAADHIFVKLRSIGLQPEDVKQPGFEFTAQQLEQMARMEHKRWCAERLLGGWRPFPPTPKNQQRWDRDKKDLKDQKLHIDLVPFDELPTPEKTKDYDQIQGIPKLKALPT